MGARGEDSKLLISVSRGGQEVRRSGGQEEEMLALSTSTWSGPIYTTPRLLKDLRKAVQGAHNLSMGV